MTPPSAVPIVHDRYSPARSSEFADGSSVVGARGSAARRTRPAGRSPSRSRRRRRGRRSRSALSVNGSATKMPTRARSATTMIRRRESRSTSGPKQQADRDRGQEVGDEQRAHPLRRAGPVVDVDRAARRPRSRSRDRTRTSQRRASGSPGCGAAGQAAGEPGRSTRVAWTLPLRRRRRRRPKGPRRERRGPRRSPP